MRWLQLPDTSPPRFRHFRGYHGCFFWNERRRSEGLELRFVVVLSGTSSRMSGWSAGPKSGLNNSALHACRKCSNTLFTDSEDVKDERLLSDVTAFKMLGTSLECGPYGEHSSAKLRWLGSQNTGTPYARITQVRSMQRSHTMKVRRR